MEVAKKEIRALLVASLPHSLSLKELESSYRSMIGKPFPNKDLGYETTLEFLKDNPDIARPIFTRGGELLVKAVENPGSADSHIVKLRKSQKSSKLTGMRTKSTSLQVKAPLMPSFFILTRLKKLMALYRDGIQSNEFQNVYRKEFGEPLNIRADGFDSLIELLQSCKDVVKIKNTHRSGTFIIQSAQNNTDYRKYSDGGKAKPVDNKLPLDIPPAELFAHDETKEGIKREIRSILAQRPNGEWAARLPSSYKSFFKKELDFQSLGYTSVIEFISSMADVARIDRPVPNGDWLLWSYDNVLLPLSKASEPYSIPENAAAAEDTYLPLEIPKIEHLEIIVVHIHNPGKFYFQINETLDKLDSLMDEMRSFYSNVLSESYIFPVSLKKIGQVCAAVFSEDKYWYRAIILGIRPNSEVEISYIDYGNTSIVKVKDLRLLKKSFLVDLPKLSIEGCLANVRPSPMGGWSDKAIAIFHEKVKEKCMFCEIVEIQNKTVTIDLIDTSEETDIYINQLLVDASVAKFKSGVTRKPSKEGSSSLPKAGSDTSTMQQQQQQLWFMQQQQQQQQFLQQLLFQQQQQQQAYNLLCQQQQQPTQSIAGMPGGAGLVRFGMPMPFANFEPMLMPNSTRFEHSPTITEHQSPAKEFLPSSENISNELPLNPLSRSNCEKEEKLQESKSSHPDANEEIAWKLDMMRKRSLSGKENEKGGRKNSDPLKDDVFEVDEVKQTTNTHFDIAKIKHELADESSRYLEKAFKGQYGEIETENKQNTPASLVVRLKLPEPYNIHMLNYNGNPHVLGCQISSLYWKEDILRSQLHQRKLKVPNVIISKEENQELFDSMKRENIPGVVVDGYIRSYVTLYRLESVKIVLNTFKLKNRSVNCLIENMIKLWQNAPKTFWEKQKQINVKIPSDSDSDSIQDSEALELEIEELRLIIKSMHFRKKRLVQQMMTGKSSSTSMHDLKNVDCEIDSMKKKLSSKMEAWK